MQLAGGLNIQVQKSGKRKVDLPDFLQIQGVAKAAETEDILLIKRLFHLICEPGPGLPVQLNERGDTFAVRFVALHSHLRDSALSPAKSEMHVPWNTPEPCNKSGHVRGVPV
jgi:hypothetical protein